MSYLKWVVLAYFAICSSIALPLDASEVDTNQLPIPPVLQDIVTQVQSGNSVDTSNLPSFMTTFTNQLQTGTFPPMLQSKKSFIN